MKEFEPDDVFYFLPFLEDGISFNLNVVFFLHISLVLCGLLSHVLVFAVIVIHFVLESLSGLSKDFTLALSHIESVSHLFFEFWHES